MAHPTLVSRLGPSDRRRRLSETAISQEKSGERQQADQTFSTLFHSACRDGCVEDVVEALRGHARIRCSLGRLEEADELARLSWTIATLHSMTAAAARAANICGIIRHTEGRLGEAREIYQQALALAREAGDDETLGIASQNLGVVANARGDLREARALYLEAICSWVRTAKPQVAASIYNNLGMVCADLEEWMEAEMHFLRGIEIAERLGETHLLAQLNTGRAEPLIQMGELGLAATSLASAEPLAREHDDQKILADIARFRGIIARLRKEYPSAESYLESAIQISSSAGADQELGEATEEMARLRWASDRHGAARVLLREARRIYSELGAEQDVARIDRTALGWNALASSPETG